MRYYHSGSSTLLYLAATTILVLLVADPSVHARKPSRAPPTARRGPPPGGSGRPGSSSSSRRRAPISEYDDEPSDEEDLLSDFGLDDEEEADEEDDFGPPSKSRRGPPPGVSSSSGSRSSRGRPPTRGPPSRSSRPRPSTTSGSSSSRRAPPPRDDYDDYEDDDYDRRPSRPSRSSNRGGSSRRSGPPPRRGRPGEVVPYGRARRPAKPSTAAAAAATLTKGWSAFTNVMPDPAAVREAAASSIGAARETASSLSGSLYREVKGLTSSELEQVMLKATRPDDTPVKGKHVERLVGVTYQISPRYDIYDAVLRKLWKKMAESDWRTTIKALYILHRFSADGAPEHAQALKARLRELRRTKDPKRKEKYFNSKQLLAGDTKPENMKFRAFMARYSHYVLLRTQCFGGVFDEISQKPAPPSTSKRDGKKSASKATNMKPITSTNLRVEHLEAASMLLKAGLACQLKDGEDCENTAIAAERVASDMIGLSTAVAIALNRALKTDDLQGADPVLIRRWCEFYSEDLLPKTRAMVKKTSSKLDAYGLFLPSRMGATLSPETLEKGLKAEELAPAVAASSTSADGSATADDEKEDSAGADTNEAEPEEGDDDDNAEEKVEEEEGGKEAAADEVDEGDEYDEYEYEEEEYYDDEEA